MCVCVWVLNDFVNHLTDMVLLFTEAPCRSSKVCNYFGGGYLHHSRPKRNSINLKKIKNSKWLTPPLPSIFPRDSKGVTASRQLSPKKRSNNKLFIFQFKKYVVGQSV